MKRRTMVIVAMLLASLWVAAPIEAGTIGYPAKGRTITIIVPSTHRYPEGIEHVVVNGGLTVENGEHTKERNGIVIRHRSSIV